MLRGTVEPWSLQNMILRGSYCMEMQRLKYQIGSPLSCCFSLQTCLLAGSQQAQAQLGRREEGNLVATVRPETKQQIILIIIFLKKLLAKRKLVSKVT